ncbi:extended synaptotagmin-3 [Dipodomys spectabilis]|uniref:extended synaptotagmin-3 n=1 Tax=Dipodomys spectabilis TaxID=105255 RepID=UPI001C54A08F|nr:extended synaptotagmin-3 [Dipodomys spectabilis]
MATPLPLSPRLRSREPLASWTFPLTAPPIPPLNHGQASMSLDSAPENRSLVLPGPRPAIPCPGPAPVSWLRPWGAETSCTQLFLTLAPPLSRGPAPGGGDLVLPGSPRPRPLSPHSRHRGAEENAPRRRGSLRGGCEMHAEAPAPAPAPAPCAPGPPEAPRPEPRPPGRLLRALRGPARLLLCAAPLYLAGYLRLGVTWLALGALLWTWWRRNRRAKRGRLEAAFALLERERRLLGGGARDELPPDGIRFPDVEPVEWANKIIVQIWPYLSMIMESKIREKLEPKIRGKSAHLRTFTFTKLYFGQKCPRVNGVQVHTDMCERRRVTLDLKISYIGDCEISAELQKLRAGVNGIQLQGTLRVILEPLLVDKPFVGAVTVCFLQKPHLQINWTGLTNLLDAPGIDALTDGLLEELLAAHLVLPNRVTVPVKRGLDVSGLRFPLPRGVLRVHLLEAAGLAQKDNFLGLGGKSDPYARVSVGLQHFRSRTVYRNLSPVWNEVFEFLVYEVPGQDLEVDLYDEDTDADDFLGSLQICVGRVRSSRVVDEWFPLDDVPCGRLHLRLEWLALLAEPGAAGDGDGDTAVLLVFLEGACHLPASPFDFLDAEYRAKKLSRFAKNRASAAPSSYVTLSVGTTTCTSKTCPHSRDPVWSQAFSFLVRRASAQCLRLQVLDAARDAALLGALELPLRRVLACADLALQRRFPLERSGLRSLVSMRLVLRFLRPEPREPWSPREGPDAPEEAAAAPRPAAEHADALCPPRPAAGTPPHPGPAADGTSPRSSPVAKGSPPHPGPAAKGSPPHPGPACAPAGRKGAGLVLLAVPGPHSPGPIKSPRPEARAPPWPGPLASSLGSSLGSLASSLASSRFDLPDGRPQADAGGRRRLGEVQLTVRYVCLRRCLRVLVGRCRDLTPSRSGGLADPYVRVYLLPDTGWAGRRCTAVRPRTLEPVFDQTFEFPLPLEEAQLRSLDVAVKSRRPPGSRRRKELGKVLVELQEEDLIRGFSRWYELTPDGRPGG